ncbi:hypothetical protein HXX76_001705 [Chlamydomonas incerta]|uniref:SRCR domain-containing protein n=1 Tax=Chlamydomonas incerta TaxID=51695 RepID=A0A835WCN0_CHLIN|nr:hypothetical protein HXX76_001705 [Chlamydomonas incerta]|eukprot:KAG2444970.1 hypothetical protein HXX76_001705 [Chlamydomonas incerta]
MPPEPPAQPASQPADAVVEQGSIVDTEAITRYWTEGYIYLGLAADLGVTGVPENSDPAAERRRRAVQELDNSELLFRSFRLHADGSLYAEAQPWALDVSAPSGERQGSVSDEEVLRRRARHRLLQQRQQEPQRPKRQGDGGGFLKQQQQWDPDLDAGDGDQAEEQEAAGTVVNPQGGPAAARRRWRRGLLQKEDARYPVRDTGYWPNNAIVQMYFVTTGTTVGTSCSGTWVTGYDVLTATHCVYNWASNATYTSFVIRPAMSGQDWNGTYKAVFTTWYRSEWNRTNYLNEVNYYDIAMIRADANDAATTIPYPAYLGYKYDCSKSLYSASTCGYPNDRRVGDFASSASYTQMCCDFSFPGTYCQADFQPTQKGYFGSASSDQYFFFISNVTCVGTEASLSGCKQTSWGNLDSCSSLDVAGVVCDGATGSGSTQDSVNSNPYTNDACTDWATRVNNATTYANGTVVGRIEVCINATWGTGAEADLSSCSQRLPYGSTQCTHGMDAGIICSNTSLTPRYSDTAQCTTLGDIRLMPLDDGSAPVNGADASGRVEICYNRRWGTICADSYWSIEEAEVLCRHLGYSYYFINTTASTGSLPVWASYTQCTGNEDKFFKCQMWGLREVTDCTSGTRAVVACSNSPTIAAPPPPASPYACSTTGALRLAPNDTSTRTYMYNDTTAGAAGGRLEFCYNGMWGTLCAEYWSTPEARVACRQLGGGLEYGGVVANGTYGFAPSAQPVWLSIANCTGKETSFAECARYSNYNYTITNTTFYPGQLGIVSLESSLYSTKTVCQSHGADLSIWCSKTWISPPPPPSPPPPAPPPVGETCTAGDDGKLRLVTGNGTSYVYDSSSGQPQTGFLQVCYSGTWGRVCAARFGTPEAHVACRQLGFAGGAKMIYNGLVPLYVWGPAKLGPAWIDGLICSGTEALLTSCYFKGWGNLVDSCPPVQGVDAGADLVVQCLTSVNSPPPPSPPVPPVANYGCDTQGALRLVDSTGAVVDTSSATTVEGAVHVCLNSSWSYVCDYLFSSNFAATVVCKQLGFGGGTPYSWAQLAARGYTNSLVQPAGMPRGPSQLQVCYGDEPTLLDCEWTAGDTFNCPTFNSVAGVFCTRQAPPPSPPVPPQSPPPYWNQSSCTRNYDIRFQDGPNPSSGRVEVCFNGTWGPICASYWDDSLSNIICRQALGTSSAIGEAMIDWDGVAQAKSSAAPNGTFPRFLFMGTTYTYQLDGGFIKPFCTGSENKLSECVPVEAFGKAPGTCSRFSEVGINCWASASAKVSVPPTTAPYSCAGFTNGTVRLVNGNTPAMGRVEVSGAGVAIWGSKT